MKTTPILLTITICSFAIAGCAENPAEGVAEATVEEASSETATPTAPAGAGAKKYTFAEASTVSFTGSKVTGSHDGGFKKFDGYFTVAGDQLSGTDHKVVIDMTSTWADHPKLEGHLKGADFFDVETYPTSTFALTSIEKGEGDNHTIKGELTLRGATKGISFPATITGDASGFNLKAEFFIKRFDFGIQDPGKADDLIRDEVGIKLDLTANPG